MQFSFIVVLLSVFSMGVTIPYMNDGIPVKKAEELQIGIDAFYNSRWDSAAAYFDRIIEEESDHAHAHFFRSMIPFWQYFFGGNEMGSAREFLKKSENAINASQRALKKTPSDTSLVLILSGLYGYRALVAADQKEYRIAMSSGFTGFGYTRQMLNMNSTNPNAMIGKGVFNYMTGSIPKEVRWLAKGVGISGDVEEGFAALELAASSDSYVSVDAQMILCHLYLKEGRDADAYRMARLLIKTYPENVIFQYHLGITAQRVGEFDIALRAFNLVSNSTNPSASKLKQEAALQLSLLAEGKPKNKTQTNP